MKKKEKKIDIETDIETELHYVNLQNTTFFKKKEVTSYKVGTLTSHFIRLFLVPLLP